MGELELKFGSLENLNSSIQWGQIKYCNGSEIQLLKYLSEEIHILRFDSFVLSVLYKKDSNFSSAFVYPPLPPFK